MSRCGAAAASFSQRSCAVVSTTVAIIAAPSLKETLQDLDTLNLSCNPLHHHRHCIATAQAKRRQPAFQPALLQGVQQRRQYPRPGCPDRMAQSDGPAVDVYLA